MYLKQLYQIHKGWFALIVLFIIMQLALDIRQDASVTPFYHYGMYSQVIKPKSSYEVALIKVDDSLLHTKDFMPQQWDNIMQPVLLYKQQQLWNSEIYNQQVKRLLHIKDSANYTNRLSTTAFEDWYLKYLQHTLIKRIDTINIKFINVSFNGERLVLSHE